MQAPLSSRKQLDCCPSCGQEYATLHFQKICEQCRSSPLLLEHDLKVVPSNYRPNSQDFKFTAVMLVEQNMRDILNRLDISETQANINRGVEKVLYVHRVTGLKRGYLEKCAAFVFSEYEMRHRMTVHQFCRRTGIELRKFNKKYLEYKRILAQSRCAQADSPAPSLKLEHADVSIKREEAPFHGSLLKEESEESKEPREPHMETLIMSSPSAGSNLARQQVEQILRRLYDRIFPSPYLQGIKPRILQVLLERTVLVREIWEDQNESHPMKEYFRVPCLVYGVIVAYKYRISQALFIEAVEQQLGLTLAKSWLTKFAKACKQIVCKVEGDDLTEVNEENPTSTLNHSSDPSH